MPTFRPGDNVRYHDAASQPEQGTVDAVLSSGMVNVHWRDGSYSSEHPYDLRYADSTPSVAFAAISDAARHQRCMPLALAYFPRLSRFGQAPLVWCVLDHGADATSRYRVAPYYQDCGGDHPLEFGSALHRTNDLASAMQFYVERVRRCTTDVAIHDSHYGEDNG